METPREADEALPTVRPALPHAPTVPLEDSATPRTAPSKDPGRPNLPRRLGPYELLEEIGHGGMGIVFRARHENLGTLCAVKVLISGTHASPEEIARFQLEAAGVARMGKHPNIVSVYDLGNEGSLSYYAMELVDGRPLSRLLREREYAPEEAARMVEKVARAIHFAHEMGIIHRDLKPENVVVRSDAEPQVMDFGLARDTTTTDRRSVQGDVMGSPNYMAPEQARGDVQQLDRRTDVYGLGGVLYEMLTRLPPHPGRSVHQVLDHCVRGEVLSPRTVRPDLPRDIETICMKCLEMEPTRRYSTAAALAEDLALFQRGEPVHARPVTFFGRTLRRIRRHPLVSALIATAVVSATAAAWRTIGPAWVDVHVSPPGARTVVNGRPLRSGGLVWPAGDVVVSVEADGRQTQERRVTLTPGTWGNRLELTLALDHGFLSLDSQPTGAAILLDDRSPSGTTPARGLSVPTGAHKLTLRLRDHIDLSTVVVIEPGQTLPLGTVRLEHESGTLALTGNPAGVSILVRRVGSAAEPIRLSPPVDYPIETGRYVIEGQLKDHFARRREVQVIAGERTPVNISLGRQLLWGCRLGGKVWYSFGVGDLDGDGTLDLVGCSSGSSGYVALSGVDGAVLWRRETAGDQSAAPAMGDLDCDGTLDVVGASKLGIVDALSGRDGSPLWSRRLGGQVNSSPALGDLNGDAVLDVVVGCDDRFLYALSGRDGSVLWHGQTGGEVRSSPALGDFDGDGLLDAAVGSGDKALYAFSGRDGAVLWKRATGDCVRSNPTCRDMNGDGVLDVLAGSDDNSLYALSGRDGSCLWRAALQGRIQGAAALEDLTGDGVKDAVVGTDQSRVYVLSGVDGAVLWCVPIGGEVHTTPVVADLDGRGPLDVIVAADDAGVCALSGSDGEVLWTYPIPMWVRTSPVVADLQGRGALDVVVASIDGLVWALSAHDRPLLWSFKIALGTQTTPAVADVDGDNDVDVVVGSTDGRVYALSGADGAPIWSRPSGGAVISSPAVADLDGDGSLEVVAGSFDARVYALSGKDGSVVWSHGTGGRIYSSPALGRIRGDALLDVVIASWDGLVYALSGRDGSVLWRGRVGKSTTCSPTLGDLNGDGVVDVVIGTEEWEVCALSGRDGTPLWRIPTGGSVRFCPVLGDLDGDQVLDAVVGVDDGAVLAISGRDGSPLWTYRTGAAVRSGAALGDLSGDGVLDVVVGSFDQNVYALSGRDGSVLWRRRTGGLIDSSPALRDLDGDRVLDVVIASYDDHLYALSGRDGALLWSVAMEPSSNSRVTFHDVDGDGVLDVIGGCRVQVYALSGRYERPLETCVDAGRTNPSVFVRFGRIRRDGRWTRLASLAAERAAATEDPWVRAVSHLHAGIAECRLGTYGDALDEFAKARALGLRPPDGAVYEWISASQWEGCPQERGARAKDVLLEALAFRPDHVFDALIDARELLSDGAKGRLRELLHEARRDARARIAAPILSAILFPQGVSRESLVEARGELLGRMQTGEGQLVRWQGYLAIIAHVLGEESEFRRLRAEYQDLSRRPESVDRVLGVESRR